MKRLVIPRVWEKPEGERVGIRALFPRGRGDTGRPRMYLTCIRAAERARQDGVRWAFVAKQDSEAIKAASGKRGPQRRRMTGSCRVIRGRVSFRPLSFRAKRKRTQSGRSCASLCPRHSHFPVQHKRRSHPQVNLLFDNRAVARTNFADEVRSTARSALYYCGSNSK